jgi:hypothetical protein
VAETSSATIMWKQLSTNCWNINKSFVSSTILGPGKAIGQVHLPPGYFPAQLSLLFFAENHSLSN